MLKPKPRKRKSRKKPSVGQVINHFSDIDAAIMPVLIDFGGMSCYQCDALGTAPKPKDSLLHSVFTSWNSVTNQKINRLAQDFTRIHTVQLQFMNRFFSFWESKARAITLGPAKLAFTRWKRRAETKQRNKDKERLVAIALVRFWRFHALQSKLILKRRQIIINRAFFVWKTHEVLERRTCLRLYKARANRRVKVKFLRKWKVKRNARVMQRREGECRDGVNQQKARECLDVWMERYLEKTVAPSVKPFPSKPVKQWNAWKRKFELAQKAHAVREKRMSIMLARAVRIWKRRRQRKRARKLKIVVYRWAVVVVRNMLFHRTQEAVASAKVSFFWRMMVERLRKHDTGRKRSALRKWHERAHMLNRERRIGKVDARTTQRGHFELWRKRFSHLKGKKLSARVIEEVAKARVAHAFWQWIGSAKERLERNIAKATEFRNRNLTGKCFTQWRIVRQLQNIRAEHYRKFRLMKCGLHAFEVNTAEREARKQENADRIRRRFLMRWAFSKMLSRILIRDGELDEFSLAELLNRKGVPPTKIHYI